MSELPIEVVNRRMSYYNAHDLEGFIGIYSPDIAIYDYPDRLLGKGHDHMSQIFAPLFEAGDVRVEIQSQLAIGQYVINEEIIAYVDRNTRYVSIYEVRDGKITSVKFFRE